jgi:hypothetical protein
MSSARRRASCSARPLALACLMALGTAVGTPGVVAHASETTAGDGAPATLMVVGVVIPDRGVSLAAIEDRATMRTRFYRVGDAVNGGLVTAIRPDRVTISFGGEVMLFRLAGAPTLDGRVDRRSEPAGPGRNLREGSRRPEVVVSPYGRIGAVNAIARGGSSASRGRGRDETGGATGGTGGGAGGSEAPAGAASSPGVRFTGVLHGGSEQAGEQFSAQSLRDLLISVDHATLTAASQRIELSTPQGALYQKFSGTVSPVSQVRVPIGGTWVTEHALFGTWTVRVYLDRDAAPTFTGAFVLSQ